MLFRFATWIGRVTGGKVSLAATLALAGACAGVARADTIISNYPLNREIGLGYIGRVNVVTYGYGILMGPDAYALTSATFQTAADNGVDVNLNVFSGSYPGGTLQAVSFPTLEVVNRPSAPGTALTFTPNSPFTLAANTTYWFMITHSPGALSVWGSNPTVTATGPGASFVSYANITGPITTTGKPVFAISGNRIAAVAEPSTMGAMVIAAAAGGACLLRRRRSERGERPRQ
jgi:hypothetical protein